MCGGGREREGVQRETPGVFLTIAAPEVASPFDPSRILFLPFLPHFPPPQVDVSGSVGVGFMSSFTASRRLHPLSSSPSQQFHHCRFSPPIGNRLFCALLSAFF